MNKAILAVMICLVTAALVGGFMLVGGPEQARAAERDLDRARLIHRYRAYLLCPGQKARPLPDRVGDGAFCPGYAEQYLTPTDGDAAIAGSITYTRLGDAAFELCGRFESTGARMQRILETYPLFEPQAGNVYCLEGDTGFGG